MTTYYGYYSATDRRRAIETLTTFKTPGQKGTTVETGVVYASLRVADVAVGAKNRQP